MVQRFREKAYDVTQTIEEEAAYRDFVEAVDVIAKQHTPDDDNPDNLKRLALSCNRCNLFKGPNLSSIDPNSGEIVKIFNPRTDYWNDHFEARGCKIVGLTPAGPRDCTATQHER